MASIRREIRVRITPERAWEAIRDIGETHRRVFPGILTDARLHGDGRIVTFANGLVLEEATVELNDAARRYAWTASGGSTTHHNASLHVFDNGDGSSTIVWITDVLPHDAAHIVASLMDSGATIMRATLEATASTSA